MVANQLEVTVKGRPLLLSVDGVFSGININDEPPFVSMPKEGVGRSADHIFEGFQSLTSCEDVVLKTRECRLAGPTFMLFAKANRSAGSTLRRSASFLGFCGVGKHSHKKAIIPVTYTGGSNLSCAYVCEGADLMSKIVLGIGIFRDFSIETSSKAGIFSRPSQVQGKLRRQGGGRKTEDGNPPSRLFPRRSVEQQAEFLNR